MNKLKIYHNTLPFCMAMLIILLSATDMQAQKKKKKKDKKEEVTATEEDNKETKELDRAYVDAAKLRIIGDVKGAILKYEEVIGMDENNDAAYYELARLYYEQGENQKALSNAAAAHKLDGKNKWYKLMLAEMYNVNEDYKNASKIYQEMTTQFPENYNFWYDYAFMLTQDNKYKDAIEVLDEMENRFGTDENIVQQKRNLYLKEGKPDKAAEAIEELIYLNPNEPTYYNMLADVYIETDQPDKAIKVYEDLLKIDDNNPYAFIALAEFYKQQGNDEQYQNYILKAFKSEDLNVDSKIRVLFPYIEFVGGEDKARETQAMEMANLLAEQHPKSAKAHALLGDFYYRKKENEKALKAYNKSVDIDESTFTVWQQIMFIQSDLSKYDALLKSSQSAIEVFPNQALPYFFNGFANNRQEKYKDAIKSLKQGTMIGAVNDGMLAQMYSQLADAYNSIKEYEKSDENFEEALKLNEEDATVLNNYSYYLTLRGENLERAEEMALKANEIEPGQPSFQDTYAWVLYRLRKYEEAKEWLEKAIKNGGDKSGTIIEHLGDVYYRLEDKSKAVELWNKAMKLGDVDDEDKLKKKIADQKLYE